MVKAILVVFALLPFGSQGLRLDANRAWPWENKNVRQEALDKLKSDDLFMAKGEASPDVAKTAHDSCEGWASQGDFLCEIEFPEHVLVRDWIPEGATVMEFGARYGTTSCELAKKVGKSGTVISVEPDRSVHGFLETNMKSHNCQNHILRGVLGDKDMIMKGNGYAAHTEEAAADAPNAIPAYHFDEIEEALGKKVDTLLIDCEGCGQHMMDQLGPKIKDQIKLVVFEADYPCSDGPESTTPMCMDYVKFNKFLEDSGFEQVDKFNDCDKERSGTSKGAWCGNWIEHYVFRRK